MNPASPFILRSGTLLAINLLFLMIWGFAGISKVTGGIPSWFAGKFGPTFLAKFPGLTATFWILAVSELAGFLLAVVALVRGEFAGRGPTVYLGAMLVWSLFVFLQLGFGQWLTGEFAGAFQQFVYFCGTLIALWMVGGINVSAQPGSRKQEC
jgi:hypothetical protein